MQVDKVLGYESTMRNRGDNVKKGITLRSRVLLILSLLIFMSSTGYSVDNTNFPKTLEESRQYANREIENIFGWKELYVNPNKINDSLLFLNETSWQKHQALVYGEPFGTLNQGHRRYLGFNPLGHDFPNPAYPPDHKPTTLLNDWDWLDKPWKKEMIKQYDLYYGLPNEQELRTALRQKIIDGIIRSYPDNFDPTDTRPWENYTLIVQPPTKYTWGYGRLWHKWDSNKDGKAELWYISIPLVPDILPPDIEVVSISNSTPVNIGTPQTARVTYRNNGKFEQTFEAQFYLDKDLLTTESITLAVGGSTYKNCAWTAPAASGSIILKAEAVPVENEINLFNNSKTCTVEITSPPPTLAPPGCTNAPLVRYSWPVEYSWTVFHPDTCTDKDGKTIDCSWSETVSETVEYSETLAAVLSVNTKQGISTDPDNPKESDRESRGSWEIIPYAHKSGLNPNEVTRAGYGFEVKVVTTYDTDYETKVPEPASPQGGSFHGPTDVVVNFFDTKDNFVEKVSLTPTSGKAGDKKITWELPLKRFEYTDGSYVWERKHYTDIKNPDGIYTVRVSIKGAGHSLCLIREKQVTIYGDLWDDSYTRIARKDE